MYSMYMNTNVIHDLGVVYLNQMEYGKYAESTVTFGNHIKVRNFSSYTLVLYLFQCYRSSSNADSHDKTKIWVIIKYEFKVNLAKCKVSHLKHALPVTEFQSSNVDIVSTTFDI